MKLKSTLYFRYPPNLHEVDLATLVSMYRERGMPKKAKPGAYFGCALTEKVIKTGKWWFGLYYGQEAWNKLLTKGCEGYPLTPIEMNVLGLTLEASEGRVQRSYVEDHCGALPKIAFMIVNDLKEYGFLSADDNENLLITPRGEKALHGIARRMYEKKFTPKMLYINQEGGARPTIERAQKKEENEQANLF